MKKLSSLLFFILLSVFAIAQKASVKQHEILLTFEQPELLKGLKTFSYSFQDDGKYWNYISTDENPTIASLTEDISIEGLEAVNENADLKIIAGFIGNQPKLTNNLLELNGSWSVMLLTKDDKLISHYIDHVNLKIPYTQPEKYPMGSKEDRVITKARIVTGHIQKYLDTQTYLLTGVSKEKLPFGIFKKTKGGAAEAFNKESQPLIDQIVKNPTDIAVLDKGLAYWTSQLETDFGKKVKGKVKNKVIYANLASVSILKKDFEKAANDVKIIKKNTGFFDLWNIAHDKILDKYKTLENLDKHELIPINVTPNTAYYIVLDGGKYFSKKKEIEFSKIEIERFIPNIKSNIATLGSIKKPKIFIYEDGVKTLRYFGGDNVTITTDDGREIIFKEKKSVFRPYVKQEDGSYNLLEATE